MSRRNDNLKLDETYVKSLIMKTCIEKDFTFLNCDTFNYVNAQHNNIEIKCNKCNYEWITSYYNLIYKGNGCKSCAGQIPITNTIAHKIIQQICSKHNLELITDFDYDNQNVLITFKCKDCNSIFTKKFRDYYHDNIKCKCKHKKFIPSTKMANDIVKDICNKNDITLIHPFEYLNNKTTFNVKCNKCGYEWSPIYSNFTRKHWNCPKCYKHRAIRYSTSEISDKIEQYCNKNNLALIEPLEYNGIWNTRIKLKCKKCEHEWQPMLGKCIIENNSCPKCKSSKLEREIYDFLKNKFINFEYQKKFDWLGKQSLDFYLPDYNIAIECQGEQHFEPVFYRWKTKENPLEAFERQLMRDKTKYESCLKHGVKILYYGNKKFKKIIDNLISNINELEQIMNKL